MVELFKRDGYEVIDRAVDTFGVGPAHPVRCRRLDLIHVPPGSPGWISSNLSSPICDSAIELSYAPPTDSTDGSMPSSINRSVKAMDV